MPIFQNLQQNRQLARLLALQTFHVDDKFKQLQWAKFELPSSGSCFELVCLSRVLHITWKNIKKFINIFGIPILLHIQQKTTFFEFEHSQKIEMDLNVQTMIPLFSKFVKQLFRHVRRGEAGGRGGVPQPPRFSDHAASLPLCYHIESQQQDHFRSFSDFGIFACFDSKTSRYSNWPEISFYRCNSDKNPIKNNTWHTKVS